MKCMQCGGEMVTKRETLFHYTASGLSNVFLADVEVSKCAECDEFEVAIPRVEQLHKVLATSIAEQTSRLAPEEIRFLRKYLGLSGEDFARRMGVTASTVSRWERGHEKMSDMAERLLRLMIATEVPVKNYSTELFDRIEEAPRSERRIIRSTERGWASEAA